MRRVLCAILFLLSAFSCAGAEELVFFNWKDYTDRSVLDDFQKKTGITVVLKEYDTEDMMFSELLSDPDAYDVVAASNVSLPALRQSRLLSEVDIARIPAYSGVKKRFRNALFDGKRRDAVEGVCCGSTGLVINTDFVPAHTEGWSVLWDKRCKGRIALMNDCREAVAAILKYSGFSLNAVDPLQLKIAEANARGLAENGVVFGDPLSNIEKVVSGELWAAQAYSGDVRYKAGGKPNIVFVFPREGYHSYVDALVISAESRHKEAAHRFIDFMLRPENARKTAQKFFYPVTVENADSEPDARCDGEIAADVGAAEDEYIRLFNLMKQVR